MSRDTLNRVVYSSLDFATATDELLTQIQINYASSYNDFAVSSLGIMIIDIVAFGIDTLAFYLDRRATDTFLVTARSQKSVARAARQLGYKMAPATAGSVDIQISPAAAQPFIIPLPIGFQIKSPDGSIWESSEAFSWPANNTATETITFSQTSTLQSIYASDGTPNQVLNIANVPTNEFIAGPGSDGVSQIIVLVNGVAWTESSLLTFGQTNQFEIGYHDTPPTLRFGDGVAGNIPPANAQISLTFKSTRGTIGQVTSGQPMVAVNPLSVNFTAIVFNLAVPTGSNGGSPPETIEKAKANAPSFFAARGVNITANDYNVRAGSFVDSVFGGVAVASAISVHDAASDAVLQTLVNDIVGAAQSCVTDVAAAVASTTTSLAASTAAITASVANNTTIASDTSALNTSVASATSSASSALISSGMIGQFVTQIISNNLALNVAVAAVPSGISDQLTSATQTSILALIAGSQSAANQANSQNSTVTSDVTTVSTQIATMANALSSLAAQQALQLVNLGTAQTNIDATSTTLTALIATINTAEGDVESLGQQIVDHVGTFLSSDCQSNLIEVPVLTLDADGFYAAPTIALVQSLQSYLDANKEVTQVVKAFAAGDQLVAAQITAHIGILTGYVESVVTSQVNALILSVLKKRPFGKSLKLSELYWILAPNGVSAVSGVDFVDVLITGPAINLDGNGNLTVSNNQVITRGTITITSEIVAP